jgi:hypothetical protein
VQAAETVLRLLDVTQPCGYEPEDVARIDGDRVQIGPLNTQERADEARWIAARILDAADDLDAQERAR